MDATIQTLPDDPAMLKKLLAERDRQLAQERLQRAAEVAARDQQITQIKEEAAGTIEV